MKIILIHGFKSSPSMNFFPWLKKSLTDLGHEVMVPELPNSVEPNPEEWTRALVEKVGAIDDETIIVGHSLGSVSALRFLEAAEIKSTPKACLLISPPWMIKHELFQGFFLDELDFDVLMWKASRFVILHSKDDNIVPFDHAEKYASVLHAELVERSEGENHFQGEEYPVILETIKKIIKEEIVYEPGSELKDQYGILHER